MVAKIPKDGVPARNSSLTRLKLEVGSCSIALPVGWQKCFQRFPSAPWLCGAARPFEHSRHFGLMHGFIIDHRSGSAARERLRVMRIHAALNISPCVLHRLSL